MTDTFGSLAPAQDLQHGPPDDMTAALLRAAMARAQGGADALVQPPRNPMAPPQAIADAISKGVAHNVDWASLPGRVMHGVQPETPGQWSEEDQFRADHLASQHHQWGPQTAFSEVFWPRTGTNVGGSGFAVGSGAMPPRVGRSAELPKVMGENTPMMARVTSRDIAEGSFPQREALPELHDPRGPWGQPMPAQSQIAGEPVRRTDAVLAQIQSALKSGHEPNSGVPLVAPPRGPKPTTEEVLAKIEEALKIHGSSGTVPQSILDRVKSWLSH